MTTLLDHPPGGRWISERATAFRAPVTATGLFCGVPCYGGLMTAATARGLLDTQRACHALGLPFACATLTNESLVPRARNRLVAAFLDSAASHLLFVDADIGFGAEAVLRLLGQDRPVVGAAYRTKRLDRTEWAVDWAPRADGTVAQDTRTGVVEVGALGAGFLCLRREALLQLVAAMPEARCTFEAPPGAAPVTGHALFESGTDPATGLYLGEDYLFCARWRGIGGTVWCDPAILLEHHSQVALADDPMTAFGPATASGSTAPG